MERGEWENEPEYPRAPLPAHERTWRHPSEQGATVWTRSEPPLVVGKGLSVATGTVGAVLAVGLLWLMIPHPNRGGGVAEVTSTVRSFGEDNSAPRQNGQSLSIVSSSTVITASNPGTGTVTARTFVSSTAGSAGGTDNSNGDPTSSAGTDASAPDTSDTGATSTLVNGGSAPLGSPSTPNSTSTPTTSATVTTITSSSTPTSTDPGSVTTLSAPPTSAVGHDPGGVALAVALTAGHFVATTASAVGDQASINVQLPTGNTVVGEVVSVDSASGIAILSIPSDTQTTPIQTSDPAASTDGATVMGPEPTPAIVVRDGRGTTVTYDPAAAVAEGSLVLDSAKHLIGMCTWTETGVHVVEAQDLLDALNGAIASERPAWLGLTFNGPDDLTVKDVAIDGPSTAAAIQVGDVITAIDGLDVSALDALWAVVHSHHPGESVTLSVIKVGTTTPTDVPVVLGTNPNSL